MGACPRGAWERGGREMNFQRTAIGLERLTTLNLARRAATFCRLAARFFGGRFWMEAPSVGCGARTHLARYGAGRALAGG